MLIPRVRDSTNGSNFPNDPKPHCTSNVTSSGTQHVGHSYSSLNSRPINIEFLRPSQTTLQNLIKRLTTFSRLRRPDDRHRKKAPTELCRRTGRTHNKLTQKQTKTSLLKIDVLTSRKKQLSTKQNSQITYLKVFCFSLNVIQENEWKDLQFCHRM